MKTQQFAVLECYISKNGVAKRTHAELAANEYCICKAGAGQVAGRKITLIKDAFLMVTCWVAGLKIRNLFKSNFLVHCSFHGLVN